MQHKQKKKQKQLEQELETQLAHEKGPKRLEEELKIHILHSYISLMAASYCCLRMVKMVRVPLCVGVLHVLNYIGNLGAYSPGTLFQTNQPSEITFSITIYECTEFHMYVLVLKALQTPRRGVNLPFPFLMKLWVWWMWCCKFALKRWSTTHLRGSSFVHCFWTNPLIIVGEAPS